MKNEKALGSISTEIEDCDEGFRVVMRVYGPQGEEHTMREMVAATMMEAEFCAQYLRGVAMERGLAIGVVH